MPTWKSRVVVVFSGGEPSPVETGRWIPPGAWVIAADSGLDHAHRLGLQADLLVGDLDSVSDNAARLHTASVEPHPEDKDQTDLELSMEKGCAKGRTVLVVGGHGGRLDHFLANAMLLADHRWSANLIAWFAGHDLATVVHGHATLRGTVHELVSLLAVGGPVEGITTQGLRWPLRDATLLPGTTLGISNRFLGAVAHITVTKGGLVAIQPGAIRNGLPSTHLPSGFWP